MKILVTGGAGFLGSHLCESLLNLGHKVIAMDNYFTGTPANVKNLLSNPNFRLIEHDVTISREFDVEGIFNLACPASPIHYQRDPVTTIKTNVLGAINLLEMASKLSIPILQASTSEVYGDPNISPQPEEYWGNVNPIGIRACYDEGKRAAETLFFDFARERGTSIKVARIFNTYGPRMAKNDGRVVTNFIYSALSNLPITIYGEGSQTRSFCYVDDLIQGLISLFFTSKEITGPINLGNPVEFTMLELAEKIIKLTNSKSILEFLPLPQDDPRQRKPDIRKAETILGWQPLYDLDAGLSKTIDSIRELS
jgi:UDP-glucuronate decarboxylase